MTLTLKNTARLAALCLCAQAALAAAALARTGDEIAKIFNDGITAYDAGDYLQAYHLWQSIDDEDVAAMRNIGILLRKGQGVAKNPARAEEMFERAADAGLATAQADLADMLVKGEAGKPDPKRALPLLKEAAAANHPIAQYELAQMYEEGVLVPRNLDAARQLYAQASRHGMKQADARLAMLGLPGKRLVSSSVSRAPSDLSTSVNLLRSLGGAPAFPALAASDPAMAAPDIATEVSGVYSVQIGSYKTTAEADAERDKFHADFAAQLGGHAIGMKTAELKDQGTWYRLRVIGFDDHAAAAAFCQDLEKDGRDCFTARERRALSAFAASPAL